MQSPTKKGARRVVTNFAYDGLNRVTQVSYNTVSGVMTAPAVSYVYDRDATYGTAGDGMLLRVNVGTDYQERYTVDPSFRVASAIRTIGARTYTTSYAYNQASQLSQLTYPSARAINVSYDSVGRLNGLAEPLPGPNGSAPSYLRSVTYNTAGQVTGDIVGGTQFSWGYTGGVTEQYGYDANRMQLISQKAGTSAPYTNRMDLTYSYAATSGQMGAGTTAGNAGQLMSISGTIGGLTESAAYTYDNLGRLATSNQTSNGSSAQRLFAYDRWGNRTGMWDATTGGNQIQSITLQQSGGASTNQIASVTSGSTVNYTYDATGNVTNDGVHSYGYDSENRLVNVDGGSTASYACDHQNRRYKKTIGSTVTHYVWQGSKVLAEHNGSTGAVLTDYVYSGSRMIAKVVSGSTQYSLSDRLSVRLSLDSSGSVLGRQSHLPFGEDFGESGSQEKHHFTSYDRDAELGSDYSVNRQYATSVGRFMRVDPKVGSLKSPQGLNRYAYVMNDSINRIDPDGRDGLVISGGHIYLMNCHQNVKWIGEWDDGEWDADPSNGETCELVDLGDIGAISGEPTQGYTPCGALSEIPTDPGERDAVAVVLGEGTSLGRLGQAQYQDNDPLGQPSGQYGIGATDLQDEAEAMVSVIANRANSSGRNWQQVINERNQFAGLEPGRRKLDDLISKGSYKRRQLPEGSEECAQLYDAVNAVHDVKTQGPTNNFLYWVGVFNPGYRSGQYARQRRPGDTRMADTDFSANPF